MKTLFDELEADGEAALVRLRDSKAAEGVQLEFKQKHEAKHGDFQGPDKKALGQTLSAFANSAGGLLVFGAMARPIDGVDALQELRPIKDIRRFASQAATLCGQYLLPRHDGIRLIAVPTAADVESGYLAIWVDRSERRPHQSKAPDDGRYYKRAGDSTFPMEHYDIEDAFRRGAVPDLELVTRLDSAGSGQSGRVLTFKVTAELRLANRGGLGRYPFLIIEELERCEVHQYGLDGNGSVGLPRRPLPGKWMFAGGADHVVHPGVDLPVTRLSVDVEVSPGRILIEGLSPADYTGSARINFGCENAPVMTVDVVLSGADIITTARERGQLDRLRV